MKFLLLLSSIFLLHNSNAQQYPAWNAATILQQMHKLPNHANVLYIAAHPDDENTRLLTYLANERKCRTAYLSLTRGDGGQNLIGAEQGVALGLIRTQELLAARSIDGAEQFFTSAYDFGFSKTSKETFNIWNKEQVLADAVWIIRKFKPDVIITRFPEDARAGHGHHAASGIIAREAFYAAADPKQFTSQFAYGVTPWKATRLVWNTFNFGNASNNTTNDKQLKIDVGQYNTLLGKSYGEIAAASRSKHQSQGFGVPSNRGNQFEYFEHIAGDTAKNDILDGIQISYNRINNQLRPNNFSEQARYIYDSLDVAIQNAIQGFDFVKPQNNIATLTNLLKQLRNTPISVNSEYKQHLLINIILYCAGFYAEATTNKQLHFPNDTIKINFWLNSRISNDIILKNIFYKTNNLNIAANLIENKNFQTSKAIYLNDKTNFTQPYWLEKPMTNGNFVLPNQQKVGQADIDYEKVTIVLEVLGELITIDRNIQHKFTDPVKGEIFQPIFIVPAIDITVANDVIVNTPKVSNAVQVIVTPNKKIKQSTSWVYGKSKCDTLYNGFVLNDSLEISIPISKSINTFNFKNTPCLNEVTYAFSNKQENIYNDKHLQVIQYDHIPTIAYNTNNNVKFINENYITTTFKRVGYIEGAGDKVKEALQQLGYIVDVLTKKDINTVNLKKYATIITGIRAYNTNDWLNTVYTELMTYIKNGGNLIVQYNTSNQLGAIKSKMAPYPFTISRNRITNENAQVTILNQKEGLLNYPNVINQNDFKNWVQERTVYEAIDMDSNYRSIFEMNDDEEKPTKGGLIIAPYGKGNFMYCSLALFRQLPAGVPGAYKLLINMIEAKPNK
jgi:LmbE family N-acetylglucosaminyl deacetylase